MSTPTFATLGRPRGRMGGLDDLLGASGSQARPAPDTGQVTRILHADSDWHILQLPPTT